MTSAADKWNGIAAELAAELVDAVYVVVDLFDVEALTAVGLRAVLSAPPAAMLGFIVGVEATHAVLVGAVDPRLADWLGIEAPHVRVRVLRSVQSAAMALGHRTDTDYADLATVDAKRDTWLAIAIEHAREVRA